MKLAAFLIVPNVTIKAKKVIKNEKIGPQVQSSKGHFQLNRFFERGKYKTNESLVKKQFSVCMCVIMFLPDYHWPHNT